MDHNTNLAIAAILMSFLVAFALLFDMCKIGENRNTLGFSPNNALATLVACLFAIFYSSVSSTYVVYMIGDGVSFLTATLYLIMFFKHATVSKRYLIVGVTTLLFLTFGVLLVLHFGFIHDGDMAGKKIVKLTSAYLYAVSASVGFVMPFILAVFEFRGTGRVKSFSWLLSILGMVTCALWIAHTCTGSAVDNFTLIPNAIGLGACAVQFGLWYYFAKIRIQEQENNNQGGINGGGGGLEMN
ncbi:Bidirectional sugar transporter SWEET [Rhynchospora pubera]|uniref:Bidirectional sugar transporter SWEET n=1 Tax=Rhynchospora pubera TaxID=906938 RepID=A0AAV8HYX5_9POAL|nr:Bidirectional sugar transporter SWEET [Rhynchospora pubera]